MPKIKILLIEDNLILREGIAELIRQQKDINVVAISDGKNSIFPESSKIVPDVVLMVMGLNTQNSLDIITSIKKKYLQIKIIGMGLVAAPDDIMEIIQAGADGFVLKTGTINEVASTIRKVYLGESVLPPDMTQSLFTQIVENALQKGKRNLKIAMRMTPREKEIINLLVEGQSNKKIAENLCIATYTVKSHVHNIMEKLALHSRLQIAHYARMNSI